MYGLLLGAAIVTLAIVLYALYRLNERLMRLEANKHKALKLRGDDAPPSQAPPAPLANTDDLFQGLRGEALFLAMAGEGETPTNFAEDAKKRFELIIRKHILATLESIQGQSEEPVSNPRTIRTLRGAFESWLPEAFMTTLTAEGALLSEDPSHAEAKSRLNAAIRELYQRLQLDPPGDFLNTDESETSSAPAESGSDAVAAAEDDRSESEQAAASLRARAGGFSE